MTQTVAPLKNVALCSQALQRAMERPPHLPGIVTFYGPSGIGKSKAAAYSANKHRAYYVEAKSSWTRKALLLAILTEMGVVPEKTISAMVDQIAEQLAKSGRPLIIDEMDHIVSKSAPEIIRDIHDASGAAILIIGEERIEHKLRSWERFHNRVLEWAPAQYGDLDDTALLAQLYARDIEFKPDILEHIRVSSSGIVSRVCINIERVRQFALAECIDTIDKTAWGERPLYSGEAPRRGE